MSYRHKRNQRQRIKKNGDAYVVLGNDISNRWGMDRVRHHGSKAMKNRLRPCEVGP